MAQAVISQDGVGQCNILYGLVTVSIGNDVMHTQSMTLRSQCTNYRIHCVKRAHAISYSLDIARHSRLGPKGVGSGREGG